MRAGGRWRGLWIVTLVAVLALGSVGVSSDMSRRLAERGPSTLLVGALFAVVSPPSMVVAAVRGHSLRQPACRFGHGLKMLIAGAVLLPVGLMLSPLHVHRLPAAWLDGVVDAVQEDYCTRPLTTVLP